MAILIDSIHIGNLINSTLAVAGIIPAATIVYFGWVAIISTIRKNRGY